MKQFTLISLLLIASLIGCNSPKPTSDPHNHEEDTAHAGEHHEETVSLTADQEKIAGIKTDVARMESFESELTVPGTVVSLNSGRAVVTPPVSGRLIKLSTKLGATVKSGQIIGTI